MTPLFQCPCARLTWILLHKDTIGLIFTKCWCSVQVKYHRQRSIISRLPACFMSLYSHYWCWFLDVWLFGGWWPCTSLFPCTPLCPVSPLAFYHFATRSFSRLFSSSSSSPAIKKVEGQSSMKYNAPGSMVKRSSTFSQFPTEKSKTFDFLNEEWVTQSSHLGLMPKMMQLITSLFALLIERTSAVRHHVKSRRELSTDRSRPTCRRRMDESLHTAGACPANTR